MRTALPKCDFSRVIKIALRHGCSSVNLLNIFRRPFDKNTCKRGASGCPNVMTLALTESTHLRDLPKSHNHGKIKFVDEIYLQFIFVDAEK